MAAVINRSTLEFRASVNTPDFPEPTWKANPDMSAVAGVSPLYWKWDAGTDRPVEMTPAEKTAKDSQVASDSAAAQATAQTSSSPALSKGDMAVHDGAKIRRLPVGNDFDFLVADSSDPLGVKWARRWIPVLKTANESRASNVTLTVDSVLKFPVVANGSYVFRGVVFFDTPAAADLKFSFNGPAGSTPRVRKQSIACGATALGTIGVDVAWGVVSQVLGTGSTGGYVEFSGVVDIAGTPGTVDFQWAQVTTNVGNTTVIRGSYLEYARVN